MAQIAGRCVFCGGPKLTKSHIWPDWAQTVVPPTRPQYELKFGAPMETFENSVPGPDYSQKTKPGAAANRQPRNTCGECNSGWMREIEEAAKPSITNLLLGRRFLLSIFDQRLIAAFLCLVALRLEFSGELRASPQHEIDFLKTSRQPSGRWWIAVSHYGDKDPYDFWSACMCLQFMKLSDPPIIGPKHCNTQVATVAAGKLCAHVFFSSVLNNFSGYDFTHLTQVWPPRQLEADTGRMSSIDNNGLLILHEAMARHAKPYPGIVQ